MNDGFLDLGGDSLKAIRIVSEAKKIDIRISVKDIFKYKTIRNILCQFDSAVKDGKTRSRMSDTSGAEVFFVDDRWGDSLKCANISRDSVCLDINIQREITANNHRAFPLCVVLSDPMLTSWYYEHYLNIFSVYENKRLTLDYLEKYAVYSDIIGYVQIGSNLMNEVTDISEYVIARINSGYYVNVCVDEYYFPGKQHYGKAHYVHLSLIYGYDRTERVFYSVGYDKDGLVNGISVNFESFQKAYEEGKKFYTESAPWTKWTTVQLFFSNSFKSPYVFRVEKVLGKLKDYLLSRGDESILYYLGYANWEVKSGYSVNSAVIEKLKSLKNGDISIDYRGIHLFAEHKKVLLNCLEYISRNLVVPESFEKCLVEYKKIAELFNRVRLVFFDLQISYGFSNKEEKFIYEDFEDELSGEIDSLVDMISSGAANEKKILTEIYNCLTCLAPEMNQISGEDD